MKSTCGCLDCGCTPEISDKDFNDLDNEEITYLNKLLQIYYFIQDKHDIIDWSSKSIGTFFVKTVVEHRILGFDEIDDAFTPQFGNVSWPDIAMMYNLKEFRVLTKKGNKLSTPAKYTEPEPCEIWNQSCDLYSQTSERFSSFQSCFDEVINNYQPEEVTTFRTHDKIEEAIQSSPCQTLEQFKNCSEYCAWHNSFFETIGKAEFIQAMSYASPQRKIYKESMSIEKKIAGRAKDILFKNWN